MPPNKAAKNDTPRLHAAKAAPREAGAKRMPSIGFVSLGCAKNLVDLQVMASQLLDEQIPLAPSAEEADIILVNTCAFIEDAREEAASEILWACERKRKGQCRAVVVTGCLPQRYKDKTFSAFPDIDAVVGVDDIDKIAAVIGRVAKGEDRIKEISAGEPARLFTASRPDLALTGGPFAYLKLGEGCNHACAYCAIPGIRGRRRSRPIAVLSSEARALVAAGFKEINVIAQDITSYGEDLPGRPTLADLLRELDAIEGDFWIRLLYGYPNGVTDDLLSLIANSRHICKYLDIPVQHSHPDILRAMRRADTVGRVESMAARIRAAIPGVTLRTTFLVGFPGENANHFQHLMNFAKTEAFDHAGAFAFSPEEGTAAYDMDSDPDDIEAGARRDAFMRQQAMTSRELLRKHVGTTQRILLEQVDAESEDSGGKARWIGRAESQAPEELDGVTYVDGVPDGTEPGAFVNAKVVDSSDYDLFARFLP